MGNNTLDENDKKLLKRQLNKSKSNVFGSLKDDMSGSAPNAAPLTFVMKKKRTPSA